MIRNTTPTIEVETNIDLSIFRLLKFYIKQNNYLIERTYEGIEGSVLKVELTEAETKGFRAYAKAHVQLRGVTTNGKVMASEIGSINKIGAVLRDAIIGG